MVNRISYPVEVKEAAIKMKLEVKTTKEIMEELNIRNETQVNTWWRWHRKGREELSCEERLRQENKYLKQEIDVLKNAYCR